MKAWDQRKVLLIHVGLWLLVCIPFIFLHNISTIQLLVLFLVGAVIGSFLPELDHLIYALFLKPHELTSQRIQGKVQARQWPAALSLLYVTRKERRELIFHTAFFQIVFVLLAFLIATSTASAFGRGLALGFLITLFMDQLVGYFNREDISHWFYAIPMTISRSQFKLYIIVQGLLILLLGYVF